MAALGSFQVGRSVRETGSSIFTEIPRSYLQLPTHDHMRLRKANRIYLGHHIILVLLESVGLSGRLGEIIIFPPR